MANLKDAHIKEFIQELRAELPEKYDMSDHYCSGFNDALNEVLELLNKKEKEL